MPRRRIKTFLLVLVAAYALTGAFRAALYTLPMPNVPQPVRAADMDDLRAKLSEAVNRSVDQRSLAREDGYVYAVDLGQLLIYAARAGDRPLYDTLRRIIVDHFILGDESDPLVDGMVLWRWRPDQKPDASGTTESLRVAQGLWIGSQRWKLTADRDLTMRILRAYCRHGGVDNHTWIIRNYFDLASRRFATNSFLIDYAPDFLAEVATVTGDMEIAGVAERSILAVRAAQTPGGLLYDLIQPEVGTMMPRAFAVFSPNDVVALNNAANVAEQSARTSPDLGRSLLNSVRDMKQPLKLFHLGRTGADALDTPASVEVYAALIRLAAELNDRDSVMRYMNDMLTLGRPFAQPDAGPNLYTQGELLLALQAAQTLLSGPASRASTQPAGIP